MYCIICGKQNKESKPYCNSCGTLIPIPPADCASSSPDVDGRDLSLECDSIAETNNAHDLSPVEIKGGAWLARRKALTRKLTQLPLKPLTAGVPLTIETVLDVLADKVRTALSGNIRISWQPTSDLSDKK